jgi:hypothetical protein
MMNHAGVSAQVVMVDLDEIACKQVRLADPGFTRQSNLDLLYHP